MTGEKIILSLLLCLAVLLPFSVLAIDFAAGNAPFAPQGNQFRVWDIVNNILNNTLNLIWVVFIGFAVIMFIWAGFEFLSAQGEPAGIEKARKALLWGIIGVAVGVLAFTIPFFIQRTLTAPPQQNQNMGQGGGAPEGEGGGNFAVPPPATCLAAGSVCTNNRNGCCGTCVPDPGAFTARCQGQDPNRNW